MVTIMYFIVDFFVVQYSVSDISDTAKLSVLDLEDIEVLSSCFLKQSSRFSSILKEIFWWLNDINCKIREFSNFKNALDNKHKLQRCNDDSSLKVFLPFVKLFGVGGKSPFVSMSNSWLVLLRTAKILTKETYKYKCFPSWQYNSFVFPLM